MPLNANLILAGNQPNFLAQVQQGNQAAAFQNQSNRTNDLANFNQANGAAVMRGDQNALNGYARVAGPEAAMGIQQGQLGMQATRQGMAISAERLEMAKTDAARQAEAEAANISAEEAAAASGRLKEAWTNLAVVPDEATYNALAQNYGIDPNQAPFAERELNAAKAAGYIAVLDAKAQVAPDVATPQSAAAKLAADYKAGLIDEATYTAAMGKLTASEGMRLVTDPNTGAVTFETGSAVGGSNVKTTEGEKSSAGYLSRMRASETLLDKFADDGVTTRSIASLLVAGTDFEGLALNTDQLLLLQAQRDWVRAKLRKESGAVIGADEMAEEIRTYFPLPGEGAEVVAQKRQARKEAEKQFEIMSGAAAKGATTTEITNTAKNLGVSQELWDFMSEEDRALFND